MRLPRSRDGKHGVRIWRVVPEGVEERPDQLAVEEPLEIRLIQGERRQTVAVTMRTPGADDELAAGFLFAEGVIDRPERVRRIAPCVDPNESAGCSNIIEVELTEDGPEPDLAPLERHFFATSACGVCGKAGLEKLQVRTSAPLPRGPKLSPEIISSLPARLREAQGIFDATGGLHAAALFDAQGRLLAAREDVGRHNALDKLLGRAFLDGGVPLHDHVVMVSGRSSYEILQKCLVAGVPIICAVSAPSSLAVELAERFGLTLVGFLRGDRFNVYTGIERISLPEGKSEARRPGALPILPSV